MATVTRYEGPCRISFSECAITTHLRADGIVPTVEVTTYSPSVEDHEAAVNLVAERMANETTEGIIQEVIYGKHGRISIGLRMPRQDFYEWRALDGSVRLTRDQVPPEVT